MQALKQGDAAHQPSCGNPIVSWQEGGDGRLVRVVGRESKRIYGQSISGSRWGPRGAHSMAQLTGRVDLRLRGPESCWPEAGFLLSKSLSTDPQSSVLGSCQAKASPFPQAPRQSCKAELGRKWETGRVELLAGSSSRHSVSEGPGDSARQA